MKAEAQPEKNVITDLADFIYLINHRLVAYCRCCLSFKTMGIVVFFLYVCPTPVGDDFMFPSTQARPYKISIDERDVRCLCKHFSTQQKTSCVHKISFSWLCEWKCQRKSSTICCLNKQMKREIIKYSKHTHTAAVVAPMVAAIVLAFMLCASSHSPFTASTHIRF